MYWVHSFFEILKCYYIDYFYYRFDKYNEFIDKYN